MALVDPKIKVCLVSGFLGAGKTTLLRHVLAQGFGGARVAVLVNELGEVGIDGATLKNSGGNVVELANGCICCQIQGDFHEAVLKIADAYKPQWMLIEATGAAEPGKILSVFYASQQLQERFTLEPTVCVVDAAHVQEFYRTMTYHVVCQIKPADLVVLNKVDLSGEKAARAAEKLVREINPRAFVVRAVRGRVDLRALLDGTAGRPEWLAGHKGRPLHGRARNEPHRHAAGEFQSLLFDEGGVFDWDCLEEYLKRLPGQVFRAKGFVRLAEGGALVNVVGGTVEREPANRPARNALVIIGRRLNRATLAKGLRRCVVSAQASATTRAPATEGDQHGKKNNR